MRKTHITRKALNQNFRKVFSCGYCDLQRIMEGKEATYYNAGVYGWNFDAYIDYANDIAITTGYRNMTGVSIPRELIKKYDSKVKQIYEENTGFSLDAYNTRLELVEQARQEFFKELLAL